jgi:hypothetical protein
MLNTHKYIIFFCCTLLLHMMTQVENALPAESDLATMQKAAEPRNDTEQDNSSLMRDGELAGTYKMLLINGRTYDPDSIFDSAGFFGSFKTFKIKQMNDLWFISGEPESRPWPMWVYTTDERLDEKFDEKLGNKELLNAPCLDSGGASRMRICAVTPNETLIWREKEYIISTGYFAFDGDYLILLGKLR